MKKPTLKFYPNLGKKSKKTQLTPVYFRIIHQGKKAEGRLKIELNDSELTRWFNNYLSPESSLNHQLAEYRLRFAECLKNAEITNLSIDKLKNIVLGNIDSNYQFGSQNTIKSYVERFYSYSVKADASKKIGTKRNYEKAYNRLYAFLEERDLTNTPLKNLPRSFGQDIVSYLLTDFDSKNEITKNATNKKNKFTTLSTATAQGYLKKIKSVFFLAQNEGEINFNPFYKVRITVKETNKAKLTIFQMRDIMSLNLQNKPSLQKIRDSFIMQFFTGCAFQDSLLLENQDLCETHFNRLKLTGTRIKSVKPFAQIATKHLIAMKNYMQKKYNLNNNFIPKIDIQPYNEGLKLIGELSNIKFPLSSQYARTAFNQAIIDAKITDIKTEYSIMGWSRKGDIDTKYGRITDENLLDACVKLENYFDEHLTNKVSGKLILID